MTIEEIIDPMDDYLAGNMDNREEDIKKLERLEKLNDFISNFEAKKKETTELEKELEKVKDMITPGQVGEA